MCRGEESQRRTCPFELHTRLTWQAISLAFVEYPPKPIALDHPAANPLPAIQHGRPDCIAVRTGMDAYRVGNTLSRGIRPL
eukprot:4537768-Ditylum_brightwellii.AAC.1